MKINEYVSVNKQHIISDTEIPTVYIIVPRPTIRVTKIEYTSFEKG